jgi:hypothetical protein
MARHLRNKYVSKEYIRHQSYVTAPDIGNTTIAQYCD